MGSDATDVLQGLRRGLRSAATRMWPDGGQGQARRNAWAAMVNDHIDARTRAEAERALALADARARVAK